MCVAKGDHETPRDGRPHDLFGVRRGGGRFFLNDAAAIDWFFRTKGRTGTMLGGRKVHRVRWDWDIVSDAFFCSHRPSANNILAA